MKLDEICENTILSVLNYKDVNTLNKKPKKLKKDVYGVGGLYTAVNMDNIGISGSAIDTSGGDSGGGDGGGGGE